jgi:hypothetical protein
MCPCGLHLPGCGHFLIRPDPLLPLTRVYLASFFAQKVASFLLSSISTQPGVSKVVKVVKVVGF